MGNGVDRVGGHGGRRTGRSIAFFPGSLAREGSQLRPTHESLVQRRRSCRTPSHAALDFVPCPGAIAVHWPKNTSYLTGRTRIDTAVWNTSSSRPKTVAGIGRGARPVRSALLPVGSRRCLPTDRQRPAHAAVARVHRRASGGQGCHDVGFAEAGATAHLEPIVAPT
jgi:hypothetical protein